MNSARSITILGAGILGVWQAYRLARAGFRVRLIERTDEPFAGSASRYAGAMLAPWCEAEAAPPVVREAGVRALELWRQAYPGIVWRGTLVLASPRDRSELVRFARLTTHHKALDAVGIADLEGELGQRFPAALFYPAEGHMDPAAALTHLLDEARRSGAEIVLGAVDGTEPDATDVLVDCRGLAARDALPALRGVRGERIVVRAPEVGISRCVRLLHPRHPLYVVPWTDDLYMIGATVIESEDDGPMTVRSALELLGAAYTVHPAFAEAEIVDLGAGVRPAYPDNVPAVIVQNRIIHVNGAYRHGFLLGPVLADAVAEWLASGAGHPLLRVEN